MPCLISACFVTCWPGERWALAWLQAACAVLQVATCSGIRRGTCRMRQELVGAWPEAPGTGPHTMMWHPRAMVAACMSQACMNCYWHSTPPHGAHSTPCR